MENITMITTVITTSSKAALVPFAGCFGGASIFTDRGRIPASDPKTARTPDPRPGGPPV